MDNSHEDGRISAFAFDIVREAFRKSVIETNMPEDQWPELAKRLLQDMTGGEPDQSVIDRIIGTG